MNKQKTVLCTAALLCALGTAAVQAEEPNRVVWVLAGPAAEDGAPRAIAVPAAQKEAGTAAVSRTAAPEEAAALPEAFSHPAAAGKVSEQAPAPAEPAAEAEGSTAPKKTSDQKRSKKEKAALKTDGQAEEAVDTSISEENPLIVSADRMWYNQTTGDVDLSGQVDARHMQDRYETEHVYGNSQTQQYVIPVPVKWTSADTVMHASQGDYDGKTTVSHFQDISGWNQGKYYFEGDSGTFNRTENKGVVQKGYFTTKHAVAKVPDYRIEADSIDIYPNDHYTAHHVSLFLKNFRLITLASYSGSLAQGDTNLWSLIPRPAYDSDNGFGLKSRLLLPVGGLGSGVFFDASVGWYTKAGFKPDVGFRWNTAPGTFRFRYAKEESTVNDDHVWVEKRPSFSFDSRHFYIPQTNFYVGARGEIGQWKEGRVSGSHKLWDVYLSHTPITMGPYLSFNWRIGYLKDYYGYNDTIRRNRYYSVGLSGHYGILRSWIHYTDNNQKGRTPYSFDTYDMDKPLTVGGRIQLTRVDALGVSYSIDTVDGQLEHRDFTYYRDLHSFYGWITYRDIDKETQIMIQPKDFSF